MLALHHPAPASPARPSSFSRPCRRAVLATAAALGIVAASAAGASAHVRVLPDSTTAGGFTQLTFRVPTESDTAGTVSLRVELPTETPFSSVRSKPLPGWTAVVERGTLPEPVVMDGATITEAPLAVVWTADPGVEVGPGQYQEFDLSVGPLPESGTEVLLPATQTYSDGEAVAWAEAPTADGSEPELPAPVLVTTAGAEDEHAAHGGATPEGAATDGTATDSGEPAAATVGAAEASATTEGTAQDTGARWLGGGGLALGAAALATAVLRRPRATGEPA